MMIAKNGEVAEPGDQLPADAYYRALVTATIQPVQADETYSYGGERLAGIYQSIALRASQHIREVRRRLAA